MEGKKIDEAMAKGSGESRLFHTVNRMCDACTRIYVTGSMMPTEAMNIVRSARSTKLNVIHSPRNVGRLYDTYNQARYSSSIVRKIALANLISNCICTNIL